MRMLSVSFFASDEQQSKMLSQSLEKVAKSVDYDVFRKWLMASREEVIRELTTVSDANSLFRLQGALQVLDDLLEVLTNFGYNGSQK
ncbi:MAG: hypothetical protein QXP01_06755 [Candidatus Hadarchaeum sp.]